MFKCKIEIVPSGIDAVEDVVDLAKLTFGNTWTTATPVIDEQSRLSPNQLPEFVITFDTSAHRDEFLEAHAPGDDPSVYYVD